MVYDIERARFCEHFNASPYRRHVTKISVDAPT